MRPLTIYPAIDLKAGRCVRLTHGRLDDAKIYNEDPADQARRFAEAGFQWLHIVDLDGAVAGAAANAVAIDAILRASPAKIQIGGGVRNLEAVGAWLFRGVERVILGSAAVKNPALVEAACRRFPGRIVLGVDARDGRVRTDGWTEDSGYSAREIVRRYEAFDLAAVLFTDIGRDGALGGVNVEATAALAEATRSPVIASGGVSGVDDLVRLRAASHDIEGVVIGKALYEGRISPADALRVAGGVTTM